MIKMGSDVEIVLRQTVMQMEHISENTLCMFFILHILKVFYLQYCQYAVNKLFFMFSFSLFENSASTQRGSYA